MDDLKKKLEPLAYQVTQCSATEAPFSGKYWNHKATGIYHCVVCDRALFDSDSKYASGSGWPSFFAPAKPKHLMEVEDLSHGMRRVEVKCICGAHLGHVFPDGPRPSGMRFCINSAALRFEGA